jgi:outer membrane receptor protein involved in Fe transport
MPRRWPVPAAACLILLHVASASLLAQATTAILRGRVVSTDRTGLPGVVVSLRSREQPTGSKQTVTDIEGNYRIPLLPVANDYVLRVAYPGFAPVEVGPIDLDAGKTVVQDVTLRSDAESTETVIVESQGNIVDTESTKTSSSYNAEFIEGLPIIGHNYQDILTLAPGVTDTDGDGNPNVHGARDTGLQYRLDGGNVTDPVSGTFGQNLNSDIIEEIEVITSGASAEYGRADGGFANIITKSGGNDFEGSFKVY